jgi:hypothetical protein
MNNEPVAWMSADGKFNKKETWYFPIPLYTHPVKEQLTDVEIVNLFEPKYDAEIDDEMLIDFARAILRKASEK